METWTRNRHIYIYARFSAASKSRFVDFDARYLRPTYAREKIFRVYLARARKV